MTVYAEIKRKSAKLNFKHEPYGEVAFFSIQEPVWILESTKKLSSLNNVCLGCNYTSKAAAIAIDRGSLTTHIARKN